MPLPDNFAEMVAKLPKPAPQKRGPSGGGGRSGGLMTFAAPGGGEESSLTDEGATQIYDLTTGRVNLRV